MSGDTAAPGTSWSGHCSTAALQGHDLSPADLDNAADTRTMCNVGFSNNDYSGLVNELNMPIKDNPYKLTFSSPPLLQKLQLAAET